MASKVLVALCIVVFEMAWERRRCFEKPRDDDLVAENPIEVGMRKWEVGIEKAEIVRRAEGSVTEDAWRRPGDAV
jgi:hypothetical protein